MVRMELLRTFTLFSDSSCYCSSSSQCSSQHACRENDANRSYRDFGVYSARTMIGELSP